MLSDCVKCWETPCVCGHDYRDRSVKWLEEQIDMLKGVLRDKKADAAAKLIVDKFLDEVSDRKGLGDEVTQCDKLVLDMLKAELAIVVKVELLQLMP